MSQRPSGCLSPSACQPLKHVASVIHGKLLLLGDWSVYIYVCVIILFYSISLLKPCLTLLYEACGATRPTVSLLPPVFCSCAYTPPERMSSSCVPFSMTPPLPTTAIESAPSMVLRRWAITKVVRFLRDCR